MAEARASLSRRLIDAAKTAEHEGLDELAEQIRTYSWDASEMEWACAMAEGRASELTALNGLLSARLASMKPRAPWWGRLLRRHNTDG